MLLDGNEVQVNSILDVVHDVARFNIFMASKELGISYGLNDLSFTDFLLFKWIKETKRK